MKISHAMLALAITATAASASVLAVAGADPNPNDWSTISSENWLTIADVYDKLVAAGYSDITQIERDDGRYEVKATAPNGGRVEIDVDPVTAKVLRSRTDHDGHHDD
ncbi:MAG: PepSY domain-containing protein [Halioglobus sp.]|nr:PepSY domain-containing protein [Halioglobus sp.]